MRIAVMGSGGVGGYFGGMLAKAGEDVTFLARGAHLAAIQRDGLTVESVAGDFHVRPSATDDPAAVGPVELILFAVKSYDTEAAAERVRPLLGAGTAVLCVQNGVDNEEKLEARLGMDRIIYGVVHVLSTIKRPGVIAQTAGPRTLRFGERDGRSSLRVTRILEVLKQAGINADASPRILVDLWEKFALICAQGGVTALARLDIGAILGCPETARFYQAVMEEIVAVGRAKGVAIPADTVERTMGAVRRLHPGMRSSLAHDLAHGNRLEVDALMGAVVRYGAEVGVPTPLNAAIYACLLPHHQAAVTRIAAA
jgi:2-dehydropantoate 2-reductase